MINYSIPAFLSNFSATEDNRTHADLKVFYKGETCDGRVFDDEFAEKMVATLPYTPVVAFYSDLKDDFIGHNSTQYIYGLVPHDANIRYEKDDEGKEWLVTEVMLYTDRIDNIGQVAAKIVGKQHSLEIDPNSVKYEVFQENGKTKIRFTDGRFVGLSVLGDKEKPAFTGSEFFTANTDFSELREKFENFFSFLQNDRGAQMKLEQFKALAEFAKLSYSQKMEFCQKELNAQLGDHCYAYIVDMYDDKFVAAIYNWETNEDGYNFYGYEIGEDGAVALSDAGKAFHTFVTAEQLEYLSGFAAKPSEDEEEPKEEPKEEDEFKKDPEEEKPEEKDSEEEFKDEEEQPEDPEEPKDEEEFVEKPVEEDEKDPEDKEEPEDKEDDEDFSNSAEKDPKVDEEEKESADEEPKDEENAKDKDKKSTCTTLSDSERQELEAFRKEKKQGLIDSFKEQLDSAVLDKFSANIDSYDYSSLEVALALEFTKANKNRQPQQTQALPFSFGTMFATPAEKQEKSYADLIRERANK